MAQMNESAQHHLVQGVLPDEALMAELTKGGFIRPSKGRTLDHIGFEVNNLEAFCKNLAANGVKFDEPYSTKRHQEFFERNAHRSLGTSIELTEGLRKF
jgi:4-hydroxyphenylpyruvate dioxygenase-like putative hemolysin